jgi:hypothetical protein
MKSSGEDFFVSAPKQAALVKRSEIKRTRRKVMFRKVSHALIVPNDSPLQER